MIRRSILIGGALASLSLSALVLDVLFPPNLKRYEDLSRTVSASNGSPLRTFTSMDGSWRLLARSKEVDPRYIDYLITYEDQRFWSHYGVDPLAISRAIGQWIAAGQVVSGASTITMQVARLLEPRPRTFLSKGIEVIRAFQLEKRLSKRDILSIYLTLAPYGGNLEGIKAASLAYFNKRPLRLTIAEAALLVALPQSPSIYRPDRHRENAKKARGKVLKRLREAGKISIRQFEEADETPLETKRHRFPFLAPHLARRLLFEYKDEINVNTHIDLDFQSATSGIIREAVRYAGSGINAAAIIVENKTANVLTYAASSNFFDTPRAGQVDYIRAFRSPGSALKPFIYAMAFDENIAHPETFFSDRERRFGGYRPVNFDGLSHRWISARHALQTSLNVPAVTLLNELGPRRFLSRLHAIGIRPRQGKIGKSPGLAIALGGIGVSLEQLVTMYSALARGGEFKKLSLSKKPASGQSARFYGKNAASAVADILIGTPRPQGRYVDDFNRKIAFKTGTSSGYRDVLAVGFDDTYTVGVWMGHPKAKPMPGKTGIRSAAPILFRIFDVLPNQAENTVATAKISTQMTAPINLRTLMTAAERPMFPGSKMFSISFPVDGSRFSGQQWASGSVPVYPIKMRDGKRPFNVFVNGKPIQFGSLTRSVTWKPKDPGFYSIIAIDRAGNVAESKVELATR